MRVTLKSLGLLAWALLLLGLVVSWCRPLLLLVCPGILVLCLRRGPRYLSDLIPLVVGISLAFWIVSFWFVPYMHLPLSAWASTVIMMTVLLWGINVWVQRDKAWRVFDTQEALTLVLLSIAAALRFSLFWRWPLAPAGGDMTMHGYMAALIIAADSVPSSHQPLLPIDHFGAYPVGFQTLTALMSLLGDIPVHRSALLMETTTLLMVTLGLYTFLRLFWDRQISAMAALLATFLPRNPQAFIQWGGDPTLLAMALLIIGLSLLLRFPQPLASNYWAMSALFLVASVQTHLIPIVAFCYTVLPLAIYIGLREGRIQRQAIWPVTRKLLGMSVLSTMLVAIWIPNFLSADVSTAEMDWVKQFQQQWSGGAWGGTIGNAAVTIPGYLQEKIFGGRFLLLSGAGLLILALRKPGLTVKSLIWGLTVVVLIINSMYWVLPFSYALYPERVALLLILPSALGVAALLDGIGRVLARRAIVVVLMAAVVVWIAVRHNDKLLREGVIPNVLMTEADMNALQWIRRHTGAGAVFRNYYGDAGLWIPAIAFRAVTDPHLNPFYFDEFRLGASRLEPSHVYVGKKKALGLPIPVDELEAMPEKYRKVYAQDGVHIYEVLNRGVQR